MLSTSAHRYRVFKCPINLPLCNREVLFSQFVSFVQAVYISRHVLLTAHLELFHTWPICSVFNAAASALYGLQHMALPRQHILHTVHMCCRALAQGCWHCWAGTASCMSSLGADVMWQWLRGQGQRWQAAQNAASSCCRQGWHSSTSAA